MFFLCVPKMRILGDTRFLVAAKRARKWDGAFNFLVLLSTFFFLNLVICVAYDDPISAVGSVKQMILRSASLSHQPLLNRDTPQRIDDSDSP